MPVLLRVGDALFRPAGVGRGDRTPSAAEQRLCARWRDEELRLLEPTLVVTVGGLAARRMLGVRSLGESVGVRSARRRRCDSPPIRRAPRAGSTRQNGARVLKAVESIQWSWHGRHDGDARYPQRVTQAPRYRTTFARLLGFLRPYKWSTAISVVLAIGSQAAALIGVYLTGSVANALTNDERSRIPWFVAAILLLGAPARR